MKVTAMQISTDTELSVKLTKDVETNQITVVVPSRFSPIRAISRVKMISTATLKCSSFHCFSSSPRFGFATPTKACNKTGNGGTNQ